MDYKNYSSPGEWFKDAREAGFLPSLAMMQGIQQTMAKLNMTFPEAFEMLEKHGKINLAGQTYIFNLNYERLLNLSETQRGLILKYQRWLPTKTWAAWATKTTGKPEGEWWLQGLFILVEVEGVNLEDAKKVMEENWDN